MTKWSFSIVLTIYCIWSNFYQWFERKFLKCQEVFGYSRSFGSPSMAWANYTHNLLHYGSDPWWKGFDVISAPERFLVTRQDDCDTFAMLGAVYFGQYINYDSHIMEFTGLHCLNYGFSSGHVIAVWQAKHATRNNKHKFFVVDNHKAYFTANPYEKWQTNSKGKTLKMVGIIGINFEKKLYKKEVIKL